MTKTKFAASMLAAIFAAAGITTAAQAQEAVEQPEVVIEQAVPATQPEAAVLTDGSLPAAAENEAEQQAPTVVEQMQKIKGKKTDVAEPVLKEADAGATGGSGVVDAKAEEPADVVGAEKNDVLPEEEKTGDAKEEIKKAVEAYKAETGSVK